MITRPTVPYASNSFQMCVTPFVRYHCIEIVEAKPIPEGIWDE